MIIFNVHTDNGNYPALGEKLAKSCSRFGLRADIKRVRSAGSWHKNVYRKPRWILGVLMEVREAVVWLDADSEIKAPPTVLMNCSEDFACYNWNADPESTDGKKCNPNHLKVSGGTLMFGYTAAALELLYRWCSECQRDPDPTGTDPVLDRVFNMHRPPVNPLWLPKSYCRIDKYWPDEPAVIDHCYEEQGHAQQKFTMFQCKSIYDEAFELHAKDGAVFVEIGCWMGESSSYMAKRIKDSGKSVTFHCVDTWKGSEGIEWMKPFLEQCGGDMYPAWQARMDREGLTTFALPIRKPSLEAVKSFPDASCDFVFIDGDHSYEMVLADIKAWLPKMKPGGMLAGDDYDRETHPGVPEAVDEFFNGAVVETGRQRCWIYRVPAKVEVLA